MNIKDHYKILNINKNATPEEIKKSYKQLALLWHPDKNKNANAIDKFKEISEAYQILSDENKKKIYDEMLTNNDSKHFDKFNNINIHIDPFVMFNNVFSIINNIHNSILHFERFVHLNSKPIFIHIREFNHRYPKFYPKQKYKIGNNEIKKNNENINIENNIVTKINNSKKSKWTKINDYVEILNDCEIDNIIKKSILTEIN